MTTAQPVFWCQLANGPLMARKVNNCIVEIEVQTWIMSLTCIDKMRAGDGNRTRMASLEGWGSTIELRPRGGGGSSRIRLGRHRVAYRVGGGVTAQRSPPRYGRGPGLPCLPSRRTSVRAEAQRRAAASHVFTPLRLTYSGVWRRRRVCVGGRPAPRARGNRWASASPSPRISLADPLGRGRSGTNALRPDTPARRAPHRRLSGRDTAGQRPPHAACGPLRRNCPRWDKPSQGNSRCTRTWSRAVVDARRGEPMAGREHQREATAHAEADYADLARTVIPMREPGAHDVDIIEGPGPCHFARRALRRAGTRFSCPAEQVGCRRQVSLVRQPVGLVPQVRRHLAVSGRKLYFGHHVSSPTRLIPVRGVLRAKPSGARGSGACGAGRQIPSRSAGRFQRLRRVQRVVATWLAVGDGPAWPERPD